ncbi:MAG TPA: hypothetical protein VLG13_01930 [Patescibacteria group bacterium]|nr:hypothetical protein [Patescibacteria group bacterium]
MLKIRRLSGLISAVTLATALVLQLVPPSVASAAQITNRSLTLQAGTTDAGAKAGGVVNHFFQFTVPTTGNIGSVKFQYCTTAADDINTPACVTPTGLDTTVATGVDDTGSAATGFTLAGSTPNGSPYITRSAASVSSGAVLKFKLQGVKNPTTENQTFFVRISTYASTDTTGSVTDSGTVAASTSRQINLTGTMPESLVFCTGSTIGTTSGVPDCSTAGSGSITFNKLFSPTDTSTASSQMAASTNAGSGYAITVNGPTMTSGSNTVSALSTADTSKHGISQFGLNLKANTTSSSNPAVGTEVAPASNGTNYNGQAATNYNTVDSFQFNTGDTVANSNSLGTDAQIFTASYIVNVPGSQPAGTYTTTLTYICTPTF